MRFLLKSVAVWALSAEARAAIRKYKPSIIAVTGSVGKTSTKDALYAALQELFFIRKSEKSFNSEIGLPLTILGLPNAWRSPWHWLENLFDGLALLVFRVRYPDWLVLEAGADRPGDIRRIAEWLPVDIAVITRLPDVPVHIEFFDSPEEVIEEKAALITALKSSGTLILNGDDERARSLRSRAPSGAQVLTYGLTEGCDVRAQGIEIIYKEDGYTPVGMQADVVSAGEHVKAVLRGSVGEHSLLPLLCAVAAGRSQGMTAQKITSSFEAHYEAPLGRMHLLEGVRDSILIDDTYNASPAAALAGLTTLESLHAHGRKIVLLGDMLELGKYSVEEHRKMGRETAHVADVLMTVGPRARDLAEAALDGGLEESRVFQYEEADDAGKELASMIAEGDVIYAKGSQSMRIEKALRHLLPDQSRASEFLVRQESEWAKR